MTRRHLPLSCISWAVAMGHALGFARLTARRQRVVKIGSFWVVTEVGQGDA